MTGARRDGARRARRRKRAAHQASEQTFAALFRASPLPLLVTTGRDGRIVDANLAAQSLSGYERSDLIGKTLLDFGASPKLDARDNPISSPLTSPSTQARELRFRVRGGDEKTLLAHASTLSINGQPVTLTAFTDITDLRRLEERLLSAQRMEVVSQIAGGIAHEFNNLLTVMQGHADALAALPGHVLEQMRHVEAIRRSVMHGAQITTGLLTFARRKPVAAEPVDLNRALRDLLPMLEGLVGRAIRIEPDFEPALMVVEIDPGQIAQILINLALNARDAMDGNGPLTIATRVGAGPDAAAPLGRGWAMLTVTDAGPGMSDDVRQRIFEPFFTTKPRGRGTGLGLSICYGIVEQAGGRIDAVPAEGGGTTIRVLLPLASANGDAVIVAPQRELPMATTRHAILVVEDEPDVREIVVEILEQAGYAVQACDSLAAVQALLASAPPPIDLLLTDLVLPGGSGLDVAAAVLARHPAVPVLFMSGYSESVYSQQTPVKQLLPKPFSSPVLLRRVRDMLERDDG